MTPTTGPAGVDDAPAPGRGRAKDLVSLVLDGGTTIRMWELQGRDQVARDVRSGGLGGFEAPMPEVFAALVARFGGIVLDVGANTGLYSLVASASGAERVVAFEPYQPVLRLLRDNLAANDPVVSARIDVVPYAVGDEAGMAELHIPPPTGAYVETSASLSPTFKDRIETTCAVPLVTVDGHVAVDGAPSMVKVDVEGMDHLVLAGATACFTAHRPLAFVEVLPRAEMGRIEDFVRALDYRILPLSLEEARLADGIEFHPRAHNQLLVPAERADEVLELVRDVVGSAG